MKAKADAVDGEGDHMITPLTTLVEAGVKEGEVLSILGLDEATIELIGDINSYNPFAEIVVEDVFIVVEGEIVKDEDATQAKLEAAEEASVAFEQVASQIFTTVNTIAEAIDATTTTGEKLLDADAIFTLAIEKVADEVKAQVEIRQSNVEAQANNDKITELEVVANDNTKTDKEKEAAQAELDTLETQAIQDEVTIDLTEATIVKNIADKTIELVDAEIIKVKQAEVTVEDVLDAKGKVDESATQQALEDEKALITEGIDTTKKAPVCVADVIVGVSLVPVVVTVTSCVAVAP